MSGLDLRPPREGIQFRKHWENFLPDIKDRKNLKPTHLMQLKVLCDLSVEYEQLHSTIELEGRTYLSVGRNGDQWKIRPEVAQLSRVIADIKTYSNMLGLILAEDDKITNEAEKETNEFK